MSEVADKLGQRLKAARELKGLNAQKVADQLHLDGWVIDALESDDYARIGPAVYGKGYLKRYAGLLGLPEAEVLEAYQSRPAAPAPLIEDPPKLLCAVPAAGRAVPWLPLAAGAVVLLCVAGGVLWWKPWHPHLAAVVVPSAVPAAQPARTAAGAANADENEADESTLNAMAAMRAPVEPAPRGTAGGAARAESSAAGTSSPRVSAANGDADSTAGRGRVRLRLSFSADSWVDVHDAMGHRLYAGNGRANSVRTIAGDAPMQVYLGVASGVQLAVNNRVVAIGPQFVAGKTAHFEAGADGVLRRDTHAASSGAAHPRG